MVIASGHDQYTKSNRNACPMTTRRTISAVIPTYNSACYLAEAVASIRSQTLPVEEIIVVDDGSADDTPTVVAGLGPDITYIRQTNAGPAAARNRGIAAARGVLIAFLDADDIWTADKLERQTAALDRHPELALVAGDMAETDRAGHIIVPSVLARHGLEFETLRGAPIPNALARLLHTNFIPTGTVLVRTGILRELGGFNQAIRYGEDLELWARIASRHAIACLPDVLMLRRKHDDNVTGHSLRLHADLVEVMRSLRGSCATAMREQDVDPDQIVASALNELGYWLFDHGDIDGAREAFSASLRERMTSRGLAYRLATILPKSLVSRLRRTKQRLTGTDLT